eukprot:8547735-Pyramimonas_sp.AAC.1
MGSETWSRISGVGPPARRWLRRELKLRLLPGTLSWWTAFTCFRHLMRCGEGQTTALRPCCVAGRRPVLATPTAA